VLSVRARGGLAWVLLVFSQLPGMARGQAPGPGLTLGVAAGGGPDVILRQTFNTHYRGGGFVSLRVGRFFTENTGLLFDVGTAFLYDEGASGDVVGPKLAALATGLVAVQHRLLSSRVWVRLGGGLAAYHVFGTQVGTNVGGAFVATLGIDLWARTRSALFIELQLLSAVLAAADPQSGGNHVNALFLPTLGVGFRWD
jgi:hypothetical protein